MKKVIAILLVVSLSFSFAFITQANTEGILFVDDLFECDEFMSEVEAHLFAEFGEERIRNERTALQQANRIMGLFPTNRLGERIYPDFIGGTYLNDYGNLVIQIVNNENSRNSGYDVWSNAVNLDDIIIEYVEFSARELTETMKVISKFIMDNPDSDVSKNFAFGGIGFKNRVEIALIIYNEEEIARFREVISNSLAIVFEEAPADFSPERWPGSGRGAHLDNEISENADSDILPMNATNLNPGSSIITGSDRYSVGFRATLNGARGFITAGHFLRVGQVFPNVGTVTRLQDRGAVDAAFITTNSNVNLTNNLPSPYTTLSVSPIGNLQLNQTVVKIGAETGITSGQILQFDFMMGNLTSQVRTNLRADGGDSGGVVFTSFPPFNLVGIVTGISGWPGSNTMFFTRASNIFASPTFPALQRF